MEIMNKVSLLKAIALASLIALFFNGLLFVGVVLAYFADIESSPNNLYRSVSLDFSVSANYDFSPQVTPNQNSHKEIAIHNDGELGFVYKVEIKNATGTLCNYLEIKDDLTNSFQPLSTFASATTTFSEKSDWIFTTKITSDDPSLQNQFCNFDFIFKGAQKNGGFWDQETISNSVISGEWSRLKLVINKVYYDVDSLHGKESDNEWVEIYNPSTSSVNISNWMIKDNSSSDVLPSVSIPAGGYAIITNNTSTWGYWNIPSGTVKIVLDSRIGDGLSNNADMLVLVDDSGHIVDQMNWGVPTSTWPNYNSDVWNPGVERVPEGYILARVPNGKDTDTPFDWQGLGLPEVTVEIPNGGEKWYVGRRYDLKWQATSPNGDDSNLLIDIWYSGDSGETWAQIVSGTENDGVYNWRIPLFIGNYYVPSENSRIKVVATESGYFMVSNWDMSDEDFCPPIDYSLLTEEEKAEVELLISKGILKEEDVINRDSSQGSEEKEENIDSNLADDGLSENKTQNNGGEAADTILDDTTSSITNTTSTTSTDETGNSEIENSSQEQVGDGNQLDNSNDTKGSGDSATSTNSTTSSDVLEEINDQEAAGYSPGEAGEIKNKNNPKEESDNEKDVSERDNDDRNTKTGSKTLKNEEGTRLSAQGTKEYKAQEAGDIINNENKNPLDDVSTNSILSETESGCAGLTENNSEDKGTEKDRGDGENNINREVNQKDESETVIKTGDDSGLSSEGNLVTEDTSAGDQTSQPLPKESVLNEQSNNQQPDAGTND